MQATTEIVSYSLRLVNLMKRNILNHPRVRAKIKKGLLRSHSTSLLRENPWLLSLAAIRQQKKKRGGGGEGGFSLERTEPFQCSKSLFFSQWMCFEYLFHLVIPGGCNERDPIPSIESIRYNGHLRAKMSVFPFTSTLQQFFED